MKILSEEVANEIKAELESLPEKYANSNFNSTHEGLAVIQEEFEELKDEVYFGEKRIDSDSQEVAKLIHMERMREEAVQLAAMCVRFIQELT